MKVLYKFRHTVCQIFHPTCDCQDFSWTMHPQLPLFAVVPVLSCVYLLLLPGQPVLLPALPLPLWQCYSKLHLLQKIGLSQVFFSFQNQESPSCLLDRLLILKGDFTLFSALSLGTGCGCGAAREGPERGSPAGNPPGRRARSKGRGARTAHSVPGAGQAGRAGRSGSRRQWPISPSRRCPLGAAAETAGTGPGRSRSPSGWIRRRSRGGATGSATRSPGSSCGLSGARCGIGLIPARRGASGSPAVTCSSPRAQCSCHPAPPLRAAAGAAPEAALRGAAAGGAEARGGLEVAPPGPRCLPSASAPRTKARNVN